MKLALNKGVNVVPKSKAQELMLERIKKEIDCDRARKDAQRAIETAKRASEQVERASSGLERASSNLERASREFDQRVGRTAREELKMAYDVELERFKTEINLVDYMQSLGWTLNRKKSTKKTAVLKAPDGRKALVSISENGHYLWHDPVSGAGGSIIDFVQQERGLNLGRVRKELRPLLAGGISLSLSPKHTHLEKSSNNELEIERVRIQMTEQYARLRQLDDSYLRSRGIIISHDSRFANVRTDERGNTCFPHYDADGIVGWEKKNFKFTGYADGGKKVGIYATTNFNKAERVVVVESGIDAISHAQLFNTGDETAYVSMGGSLTKEQLKLLADKLKDREVVFALDNDEAGERFAQQIANVVGRDLSRSRPPKHAKDWNDVLIMEQELEKQLKRERAATRTRSSSFELGM
ncbi:MAG TPA: toprim domain-containing protein [Piscirickettsiaceae bacterium]|nr:toprim domain-containing protein [Piscirickettsiaceae bacterium]